MRGKTHLIVGATTWVTGNALVSSPHLAQLTVGTLWAGAAALLPDVDRYHPFGRKLFGGHRHATHSLVGLGAWTGLVLVAADLANLPWWTVPALITGWLTHIVTDSMTVMGCPWLWPSLRKFWLLPKRMRITTGGKRRKRRPAAHERWVSDRHPAYGEWLTVTAAFSLMAVTCALSWRLTAVVLADAVLIAVFAAAAVMR